MIYTSSFGKMNLDDNTKIFIAVVRKLKIHHERLHQLVDLSPQYELIMGLKTNLISMKAFKKHYLGGLDKNKVEKLISKSNEAEKHGLDVVLLCYEDDHTECHRSHLAEYIFENFGIEVKEI